MGTNISSFVFEKPLIEGIILKRRNRFIMEVDINGKVHDCHCPTTGSIGDIVFCNIPCLLSQSNDTKRKTLYTVEAISLDLPNEENKSWVGINQNSANRYVEHFFKTCQLSDIVKNGNTIKREQKLGNSKLDFLVENSYIEVKTPLTHLQIDMKDHVVTKRATKFNSYERFVKHVGDLAGSLERDNKAILLLCFIYDNPHFKVLTKHKHSDYVKENVLSSIKRGIEIWQVNFKISPTEVSLIRYFEITDDFIDVGNAL